MSPLFHGVYPAATTQFHDDLSLDLDATKRHLEVLIEAGAQGLVMLGSLGENNMLDPDEKVAVLRAAVEVSNGRVPVVSGVSEFSTAQASRHAEAAAKAGCKGLMVLPAMVYPADDREVIAHYRSVAKATDLPIIVYNNPVAYKIDVTPAMLEELADDPKFQATKESSADPRRVTDLINRLGDRYVIMGGVDDLILECALLGAKGWIAGVGLAFPRENQRLWDLAMAGKWEEAVELYRWFTPLLHLDIGPKFVQKIKLCLQEVGLGKETVRPPRLNLSGAEREETLRIIREGIANRPVL